MSNEKLREIIKYHIEAYGGKINPKDDFQGFIYDIKSTLSIPKKEELPKNLCPLCSEKGEIDFGRLCEKHSIPKKEELPPPIQKMPHYGFDLANKNYKQIIQNVWDKLNEIIERLNKEG